MAILTIALVEDDLRTMQRFKDYFKFFDKYKVIIESCNGHDLIHQLNSVRILPDIVLIDINMPVMDGASITYYLRYHYPSIKLIGLSNYSDENNIKNMLLSGADGFVIKAMAEEVLEEAIHLIMLSKIYIDKRMSLNEDQLIGILEKRKERLTIENVFDLTTRERTFIMLNATTLSYEQIAETMFVETKTVHTYYDRISKKLNLHTRQALTLFSLQNGLAAIANFN